MHPPGNCWGRGRDKYFGHTLIMIASYTVTDGDAFVLIQQKCVHWSSQLISLELERLEKPNSCESEFNCPLYVCTWSRYIELKKLFRRSHPIRRITRLSTSNAGRFHKWFKLYRRQLVRRLCSHMFEFSLMQPIIFGVNPPQLDRNNVREMISVDIGLSAAIVWWSVSSINK